MINYYSQDELNELGLKRFGEKILISKKSVLYNAHVISLGDCVRIDDFCVLSGGEGIAFGSYIHMSAYSCIFGGIGVEIGDYSGLSPRATVMSATDDFSGKSMIHPFFKKTAKPGYLEKKIIIGRFCQIGINSTLLPGANMGEGAVVGAHSLVKNECLPWSIYAGVPATLLKKRKKDLLGFVEKIELNLNFPDLI